MSGQIVVVSGTSGSGKTTTTQTFARRARDCYLMMGLDVLVGTMQPAKFTLFGENRKKATTISTKIRTDRGSLSGVNISGRSAGRPCGRCMK